MRVLSFIPALLAVASFVVAAPTTTDSTPVSLCSSGGDEPLQGVIAIFANATTVLNSYPGSISNCHDSGSLSTVLVEVTDIVVYTVVQVQAVGTISLSGLDLTNFCSCLWGLLNTILAILNSVLAVVLLLGVEALLTVGTVLANLLAAVLSFVNCLDIFVDAALTGVLGPVLTLLCTLVDVLQTFCGGASILSTVPH